MTLRLPTCECSHAQGDHRSSGASWPHPVRYGLCRVAGCTCREYVERDDEQERAEAWLTDLGDVA